MNNCKNATINATREVKNMIRIAVGGLQKNKMESAIKKACPDAQVTITTDMGAVGMLKRGEVDYYFGACNSGGGAAISILIGMIGYAKCCTACKNAGKPNPDEIRKHIAEGKIAFGMTDAGIEETVPILGGAWGILCLTGISGINTVLTGLPVDMIGALGSLGGYIVTGFAVFPIVAIVMQFGFKKGIISAVVVLFARILGPKLKFGPSQTSISDDSWTMFVGVIMLVAFAIAKDMKNKTKDDQLDDNVFTERVARIRKNLPFLMAAGALIAVVCNMRLFAGSTVSMFNLAEAYASTDSAAAQELIRNASMNEFFRGISFIPLIATTAITTGVYGIAGFTFVYVAGYLSPNPIVAAILGAIIILVEVMLLSLVGKFLGRFPSMRDASDNIRSAMGTCVEFALIFGSLNAVVAMGSSVGSASLAFMIAAVIYLLNEITGRKIMKMAIGPVFAVGTGVILNLLYLVGLVSLAG